MMSWKTLTTISLAAGLTFAAADARAQAPAAGAYTLQQVNGQELPVVTETTDDCRDDILSGTLTLEANGEWQLEYVERETCGADIEEDQEREDGSYTVDGQTVLFSDDTDAFEANDLDIDELGTATLNGNELSVTLQDGQTVLVFRK